MAEITEYVEFEISPREFIDLCSKDEIKELVELLRGRKENLNFIDEDWTESVSKLMDNRHRLTIEEEEIIKKISNKL